MVFHVTGRQPKRGGIESSVSTWAVLGAESGAAALSLSSSSSKGGRREGVQGVGRCAVGLFPPSRPALLVAVAPHTLQSSGSEGRELRGRADTPREDHVSAGAAVTPCCPMRRAASRTASRTVRLVALLLLARAAGGSEFPERECCDPVYPLPAPPSSTTPYPSVPTATGRIGEYPSTLRTTQHQRRRRRSCLLAVGACVLIRVLRFLGRRLRAARACVLCCSVERVLARAHIYTGVKWIVIAGDSGALANWPVLLFGVYANTYVAVKWMGLFCR